jgi:hypothetical protein
MARVWIGTFPKKILFANLFYSLNIREYYATISVLILRISIVYCANHNPMTGFSNKDHASGTRVTDDVDIKNATSMYYIMLK